MTCKYQRLLTCFQLFARYSFYSEIIQALIPSKRATKIKIIAAGDVGKAVVVTGVKATKGAQALIEAAGGKVN